MDNEERNEVIREVRRIVAEGGFEPLRLAVGRDRSIHLVLDKSQGRVTVDETARMNLRLRRELFELGFDTDSYRIEVESPGAFRPLLEPKHFMRFVGERVRVVRRAANAPQRVVTGALERADAAGIRVAVEGGAPLDLPYSDVSEARLEPELPF